MSSAESSSTTAAAATTITFGQQMHRNKNPMTIFTYTNHASTIPDSNLVADLDIKKPAGGNAIGYASTYVMYLKSTRYSVRAIPVKCPFEPSGFESFTINEMGVASQD
jgi:hypothetical protein